MRALSVQCYFAPSLLFCFFHAESQTTGMLVVESVIPGSPADKQLEAGDILLRVQGVIVTHFLQVRPS